MENAQSRLAAIMFTDIVGFSRMMEENESATLQVLEVHDKLIRQSVEKHRGHVIKTIGDAFLVDFQSAKDAVTCALEIQDDIQSSNKEREFHRPLFLRIGIHLGDIYFTDHDALGEGINIASRLQSQAKPGRILVSREVYSQVSGRLPLKVNPLGQLPLKNITREIHAYEIIPASDPEPEVLEESRQGAAAHTSHSNQDSTAHPGNGSQNPGPGNTQSHYSNQAQWAGTKPSNSDMEEFKEGFRILRDALASKLQDSESDFFRDLGRAIGKPGQAGPPPVLRPQAVRPQAAPQQPPRHQANRTQTSTTPQSRGRSRGLEGFLNWVDKKLTGNKGPRDPFQEYKSKLLAQKDEDANGFRGHLISYGTIIGGLAILNMVILGGGHPWFLYPALGWGIGLVSHWATHRSKNLRRKEVEQLDSLSPSDFGDLKKFHEAREGWWGHLSSNIGVMALLFTINTITGGSFPWWLIPSGFLFMGLMGHGAGFAAQKSKFMKRWKSWLASRGTPGVTTSNNGSTDPVEEAHRLQQSISSQLDTMKTNPFGEDIRPQLGQYVKQIEELTKMEKEIDAVIRAFPMADLMREEISIRKKLDTAQGERLKVEYQNSLEQVSKQKHSAQSLREQQELMVLRRNSAVGTLKKLQMDLTRIRGYSDDSTQFRDIKLQEQSRELSQYIDDYRNSMKELENL